MNEGWATDAEIRAASWAPLARRCPRAAGCASPLCTARIAESGPKWRASRGDRGREAVGEGGGGRRRHQDVSDALRGDDLRGVADAAPGIQEAAPDLPVGGAALQTARRGTLAVGEDVLRGELHGERVESPARRGAQLAVARRENA